MISYSALKEQITHNGVSQPTLTFADKTQISYLLSPAYQFRMSRGTRNLTDLMIPKIFSNLSWSAAKMCLFCGRIALKPLKCLCFKLILVKVLQRNLDKFIRFHVPSHHPRIYLLFKAGLRYPRVVWNMISDLKALKEIQFKSFWWSIWWLDVLKKNWNFFLKNAFELINKET